MTERRPLSAECLAARIKLRVAQLDLLAARTAAAWWRDCTTMPPVIRDWDQTVEDERDRC